MGWDPSKCPTLSALYRGRRRFLPNAVVVAVAVAGDQASEENSLDLHPQRSPDRRRVAWETRMSYPRGGAPLPAGPPRSGGARRYNPAIDARWGFPHNQHMRFLGNVLESLRAAVNLSLKVGQLEQKVLMLELAWTDFVDIQRAREERFRKRAYKEFKDMAAEEAAPTPANEREALRAKARLIG